MIGYFRTKLETLLDSALEPYWERLMTLSSGAKLAIVLACGVIGSALLFTDFSREMYVQAKELAKFTQPRRIAKAWFAGPERIPLSKDLVDKTRDTADRLSLKVRMDLLNAGNGATPWSGAQGAVALASATSGGLNKDEIAAFIRSNAIPGCACWAELPGRPHDPQALFISGWVMAALADMGIRASYEEIRYVLDAQTPEGWWPTFKGADLPRYASSYGTAWVLIGLQHQKRQGFIDAQNAKNVDIAMTKAIDWLIASQSSEGQWAPYPDLKGSVESGSISGLVIHALNLAAPHARMIPINRKWIDHLPGIIPATENEHNLITLEGKDFRAIDHFAQIKLPWMLIATTDAYSSGDVFQRAKALKWLEKNLNQKSLGEVYADDNNWWRRPELLYGLAYVMNNAAPTPGSNSH